MSILDRPAIRKAAGALSCLAAMTCGTGAGARETPHVSRPSHLRTMMSTLAPFPASELGARTRGQLTFSRPTDGGRTFTTSELLKASPARCELRGYVASSIDRYVGEYAGIAEVPGVGFAVSDVQGRPLGPDEGTPEITGYQSVIVAQVEVGNSAPQR